MKRDMDLVRQILLNAEAQGSGFTNTRLSVESYTDEQIDYHAYLMWQAGLVEASDTSASDSPSPSAILHNLTWKGHDFLDAAKSNTVWEKAKEKAKSVGGALAFDLLKELLVATARSQLELG